MIDATAGGRELYGRADFYFGGVNGRIGYFDLPDGTFAVTAFLGRDNVLRIQIAGSSSRDFAQTNPLLFTLRFTNLPLDDDRVINLGPQVFSQ
ncbi:MAG: hypothetical protein LC733_10780 [Actinobacteria bacterium]|nr:hypothetical protein [Actinomycetota bacterium]